MGSDIYYHEYTLRSRGALNALSDRREHPGLLLRIGDGVGCVHPWPELGDAPVEAQLKALRAAEPTPLIARAYRCAGLDGLARREGRNLLKGLEIPESHALVSDVAEAVEAVDEGFDRLKLKCGIDGPEERSRLEAMVEAVACGEKDVQFRLDFNELLSENAFRDWWRSLSHTARERHEFVEDPFPYDGQRWEALARETGAQLALDRQVKEAQGGFDVAVVKPTIDDPEAVTGERGLVVTSYMDHPVGQMYAAYEAAVARGNLGARVRSCGLLTHRIFERDDFLEAVVNEGPQLVAPEGTGLGFDDLLGGVAWKALS